MKLLRQAARLLIAGCMMWLAIPAMSQPNITRVEYYIDTDPGYGAATTLSIPVNSTDIANATIAINPASISEGVHRLYVRAKSANGWSLTNTWLFYKPYSGFTGGAAPTNINRIEYYFDTDPGFGNATALPASAATNLADLIIPVDPSILTEGVHQLYLRARSGTGWSLTNRWLFYKPYSNLGSINTNYLTNLEYFIDADPGYGSGIPVAIEQVKDIQASQLFINISGLTKGTHRLNIRGQDSAGSWSMVNSKLFSVTTAETAPSLIVNSITRTTFCARDSFTIGYHVAGTYTAGNTFKAFLSDAAGSFTSETQIGTITSTKSGLITCFLPAHLPDGTGYKLRIKSSNTELTGAASSFAITIRDRPNAQTITGKNFVNGTLTYPYSVPNVATSTYNWQINGGIKASGASTNAITTTFNQPAGDSAKGFIRNIETNQYGCVGDTSLISPIIIYKLDIGDTVAASVCKGFTLTVKTGATGSFEAGNNLVAELSDASGVFTNPAATVSKAFTANGVNLPNSLDLPIPAGVPNGTNYRVRIRSTSPAFIGDTSAAISIIKPDIGADISRSKCVGFGYDLRTDYKDNTLTYAYFTNGFAPITKPDSVNTGIYAVIATNSTGCKDTAMVTVSNYPKPDLGADKVISTCIGFPTSLTSLYNTQGITYSYFNQNFVSVANPGAVNAGIYQIIGTNSNGCRDTAMVTVSYYPKPDLGADLVRSKCVGFGFDLTSVFADPALTYSYFTLSFGSLSNPSSVNSGVYQVVGTNNNGCKDTVLITVQNYPKPNIGPDISGLTCPGFGYNLTANYNDPSLVYKFYTQDYQLLANASSVPAGVYRAIGTNNNGCADTAVITVSNAPKPNLGADIGTSKCPGSAYNLASLFSSNGLTYAYYNANFELVTDPANVPTGIYQVTGTNISGCSDTVKVTVTDNAKPALGADTTVYHVCTGEKTNLLLLYATTGLTAVWNTGTPASVSPGTYRLVVTNSFGCTDTAYASVILETATWKGTVSNNWHTAANWSTNKVPSEKTHVIVPAATPNPCVVNDANATAASIQLKTGANMQVTNSHTLETKGNCSSLPSN